MYRIYIQKNGTCECSGRIQDGTERWTSPNLKEAIKQMIQFAKIMNGTKLTKRGITFLRLQKGMEMQYVEFKP